MIAEVIPEAYDAKGRKVLRPDLRRHKLHPTFPMGRYVSQPLAVQCKTIRDIRTFLAACRYVSDEELFGKRDYWQPPEDFERIRKGDCEDFSLWTWRQFLALGYDARVVFGRHGRFGTGHAWVTFEDQGRTFLVEPQYRRVGDTFPRLSTLQYHPELSVKWDGGKISFYSHADRKSGLRVRKLAPLALEWAIVWAHYSLWVIFSLPGALWLTVWNRVHRRSEL
jgi:hypothetical protein